MKNTSLDKKKIEELIDKIESAKGKSKLDLSSDEDLSIAVMNLISIEEHLFFTAAKTGKIQYLDVLDQVRVMRRDLLKKIVREPEGEIWCISKHLLAATMRLEEVGTKSLNRGKKDEAWELFQMAFKLYSLFWGLNLGVIKSSEIAFDLKKSGFTKNEFVDSEKIIQKGSGTVFDKLGDLVKKAIDCCIE
jgi:hypothetical protein